MFMTLMRNYHYFKNNEIQLFASVFIMQLTPVILKFPGYALALKSALEYS